MRANGKERKGDREGLKGDRERGGLGKIGR